MKLPRHKFGFALISVLALITVLTIMLGALMGTNRTAFGMLRVSASRDRMDRTISTVYAYCRFRMEHDYRWGKDDFAGRGPLEWGHLRLTEVRGSGGSAVQILRGEDLENQTEFSVEICNNLRDDGEVATLKDVIEGDPRSGVPTGFCRLRVAVQDSGQVDGAEIMVRNPGLVSGVCLANECLEIDADRFDLFTKDPIKNQARSLGGTQLTGASNFFEGTSFDPGSVLGQELSSGFASRDNPVIWSGTETTFALQGESLASRQAFKDSHPNLAFKDQRFVDESQSLFDIPDVGLDGLLDVTRPDGSSKPVQQIPAGVYRFEQLSANGNIVRLLTRRGAPTGDNPASGPIEKFWYMDEGTTNISADALADRLGAPHGVGVLHEATDYVSINGGAAKVDLLNRRMVLDETYNFEVEGDFTLIGSAPSTSGNPTGDADLRQVNPSLYFGDPEKIADVTNFAVGAAANQTNGNGTASDKGSLEVRGKLYIQGDISGSTTLAASDDVKLEISRFFDPRGNSEVNFSVFSEKNVSILPPPILEDADDRPIDEATGQVQDVITGHLSNGSPIRAVNVSEKNLRFTGLIYAGEGVQIDLQDTRSEAGEKRNLYVEGAIVAKRGHLDIKNAEELRLVYNPQFVDRLLPNLTKAGQRRIEVTGWRTTKPVALTQ